MWHDRAGAQLPEPSPAVRAGAQLPEPPPAVRAGVQLPEPPPAVRAGIQLRSHHGSLGGWVESHNNVSVDVHV